MPADLREVLGRLSSVHRRHVVAEKCGGFQNGTALRAAETAVALPHVEGERHASAEELGALVAVEFDAAMHEVAVLVQVRTIGERLPANVARQFLLGRPRAVVRGFRVGTVEHSVAQRTTQLGVVCPLVTNERVDAFEHRGTQLARKLRRFVVHANMTPQITLRRKRLTANVAGI